MWNTLLRYFQQFDTQGRARFAALSTDTERLINTKATANLMAFIVWGALILPYFFSMAALILHFLPGFPISVTFWLYLLYMSIWLAAFHGGVIGYALGWGMGLNWQGKRQKAGLVWLICGILIVAYLALWELLWYEGSGLSLSEFLFWAIVAFSPGYFSATGMAAWGLSLLSNDSTAS